MAFEPGATHRGNDEHYARVLLLSSELESRGVHVQVGTFLATVDILDTVLQTSAKPLTNKVIRHLLTSQNPGSLNSKLSKLPQKLFQSFTARK